MKRSSRRWVGGIAVGALTLGAVVATVAVSGGSPGSPVSAPPTKTPTPSPPTTIALPTGNVLPTQQNVGIQFSGTTDGWLVLDPGNGGSGEVEATTDGGSQWQRVLTTTGNLWGVDFISPQIGWAVGTDTLQRTTNAGHAWSVVGEPSNPLESVDFVSSQVGWGVTRDNTLVDSSNGGQTWVDASAPTKVEAACFSSSTLGWLIGQSAIYATSNGGKSWVEAYESPRATSGPGSNTMSCNGNDAWAQFDLGAGMGQESVLEVRTTSAAAVGSWKVVGASGPKTTAFPQLDLSGQFASPAVGANGQAVLVVVSPTQHVTGVRTGNAGSSFEKAGGMTVPNIVTKPHTSMSAESAWASILTKEATGRFADRIFELAHGSSAWQQIASVPVPS